MAKQAISRRDFIKGMAAGAASVVALGVLNACDSGKTGAAAAGVAAPAPSEGAGTGLTYTPGTYTATAKGIASECKVEMTFDEKSITAVKIDTTGETPDIGGKAAAELEQAIMQMQSADIDAISGATVTTDAVKAAAADCISQASGGAYILGESSKPANSDWLGEAPEIADGDVKETIDTEVAVIGCGTGGWIATMTAAEEGAKVLVVEMGETPTGIREDIGAIGSRYQLETIKKFPEQEINKMEAMEDIVRYASGYVDYDLIKVWANESAELVEWLSDLMEATGNWYMQHEGGIGNINDPGRDKAYSTGHSPHKTDKAPEDCTTNSTFMDFCDATGNVTWKFQTKLVKLVQDDNGKVTGFIAQDLTDEKYIKVNTSKGVIMATGGYATNTDMMLALQPMTMEMKINVPIGSKADGSGIKAMLWAGSKMDPTHMSMMFNRASCLPTETAGYKTNGKWYWFGEQPFLKVNLNGKRFCNESGPYEFMLHSMYMQPNHTYCDIFDANNKKYCEQFDEVGCCRLFPFDNGAISNMPYDYVWGGMTEGENSHLEMGYLQKADTLEELAEKLNIPVDNFVASVKRYNELCAKGVDEDYGKEKHRLTPVDTAPFYGIRTGAWHLTTLDGCRINADMQVLREDGSVIEGLWATGDCTGGFFATNYPNLFTGLACGRTMTFGRHAAKMVAHL